PEPVAPAPPSPALLSQVHGKAVSRETILTGMGGNGTKVVLKQVDGGMVLSFPGIGIQLKGELLADGNYRFQGKRYVYITSAHGAGGLLLREFYLDGEKTTGWSAHATEASALPATFPTAGYGKRPAFTTNAYFSDKLITVDGYLQPNAVINVLPSDRPGELGFLVLDMILVKGIHHFSVVIRGEGEKQPGDMRFEAVEADQDGTIYTAVGVIEGPLPAGWLTFRVVDRLNDRDASDVGVYRILAKELPQVEESGHSEPLLGNPPQ
ncbi:MAG: hypothetical protein HQL55_08835, partial [Magnetococcales bacterium]|nr:hypothetical protein [Magnetococcales bacterium]